MTIRLRRLDRSGDTVLATCDTEDPATVAAAERFLAQARRDGCLAYTLDDAHHGVAVTTVAEARGDIYLARPMQGG